MYTQTYWFTHADLRETQAELDSYAARTDRRPDTDDLALDLTALLDDLRTYAVAAEQPPAEDAAIG